jgi:hypothetical protein
MAKALLGHVGSSVDLRMASEIKRLRDRVRELEGEVVRLRAENAELTNIVPMDAAHVDDSMLTLSVRDAEPALT